MKKTILIDVDASTWPRAAMVPSEFAGASGTQELDLGSAFLMLGTLTMPDILSPASPAPVLGMDNYGDSALIRLSGLAI
jgi:hypothetical protein